LPGPGGPVGNPQAVIAHVLAHRAAREAEILAALARGPATVAGLVAGIYAAVDPALYGAAGRNVLAHLIDLSQRGLATAEGPLATGMWRLAG
jgi:hydroxyacylglutathione hydrolase